MAITMSSRGMSLISDIASSNKEFYSYHSVLIVAAVAITITTLNAMDDRVIDIAPYLQAYNRDLRTCDKGHSLGSQTKLLMGHYPQRNQVLNNIVLGLRSEPMTNVSRMKIRTGKYVRVRITITIRMRFRIRTRIRFRARARARESRPRVKVGAFSSRDTHSGCKDFL